MSAAIARHLGIDLSIEGKAAMRRRGVALVVHGAPLSGKWGLKGRSEGRVEGKSVSVKIARCFWY